MQPSTHKVTSNDNMQLLYSMPLASARYYYKHKLFCVILTIMSVTRPESELSKATSLISVAFNLLLLFIISILGNVLYVYRIFTEKLAYNQQIIAFTIPNNSVVKSVVTFAFWLIIGALSYVVFLVSKSLISIINDEYALSQYVNHPKSSTLLGEGTMNVLYWIVLVVSTMLLFFTIIMTLLPSARVLISNFTLLNLLTYIAYMLVCVFFMRCIALFSHVIRA